MKQWKVIGNMQNYEVSDAGEVRNRKTGRMLSQHKCNGYLQVALYDKGNCIFKYVHRLVAFAFLGTPQDKKEVNHKDGNRSNNHISNLEWVTASENILHSYRELERKEIGAQKKIRMSEKMRLNLKTFRIKKNLTQAEFAKKIGISRSMYSFIEVGERDGSFDFWLRLQKAFSIPDEEMFALMKYDI